MNRVRKSVGVGSVATIIGLVLWTNYYVICSFGQLTTIMANEMSHKVKINCDNPNGMVWGRRLSYKKMRCVLNRIVLRRVIEAFLHILWKTLQSFKYYLIRIRLTLIMVLGLHLVTNWYSVLMHVPKYRCLFFSLIPFMFLSK